MSGEGSAATGSAGADAAVVAAVRAVVEPIAASHGLDLEAIDLSRAGRHRRLGIAVDRDGGVDLDVIAEVSGEMSSALDDIDALGDMAYTLEVSSPGIDRPLTLPRHWRRNLGRLVEMSLVDGSSRTGRIAAVDEAGVTLGPADTAGTSAGDGGADPVIAWADIDRGLVQIDFGRGRGDR